MNNGAHQQQKPLSLLPPTLTCEICNTDDCLILHNVVLVTKSPPQRVCTSCVIKHFQPSLCSECIEPYDPISFTPPPSLTSAGNNRLLTCLKCNAWAHSDCPRVKSPYKCPACYPNYKDFDYKRPKIGGKSDENHNHQVIDKEAAKKLYAAAKVAAYTMNKAAGSARAEAERRVKEAALAKKRAKEAIDHVMNLSAKFGQVRQREAAAVASNLSAMTVSSNGGGPTSMNYTPTSVGNGNGVMVTVPTPVSVVMPGQQVNNVGSGGGGEMK